MMNSQNLITDGAAREYSPVYPDQSITVASRSSLTLRDIADTLFRRKRLLSALFALWTAALLAYLLLSPKAYESEVLLLVKNNRAQVVLSADQNASSGVTPGVTEAQIATEVQLLSGPELLQDVVRKTGLDKKENQQLAPEESVERAAERLQRDLKIAPVLKGDLIRLRYSSSDPRQTVAVLKTLVDTYMDRHLSIHQSGDAFPFFDRQVKQYEQQLRDAQGKLASFQQRTRVVSLDQQKEMAVRRVSELETALRDAEAARRESGRQVEVLKQQMEGLSSRVITQSRRIPNQYSVERLNTMLAELQNKRTELLTKFNANDRMVQQLDQQIHDTQNALRQSSSINATEEATDINPLRQAVERQLAQAQIAFESARVRSESATRQIGEVRSELGNLEQSTGGYDELQRNLKEIKENYILYSKKREEARISSAMDWQKIANIAVAEGPLAPRLPKEKLTVGLIAAYLFGIALMLAAVFLAGSRKQTYETPWELEMATGMPVLATVALDKSAPRRTSFQPLAVGSREILISGRDE